ncbi:MAG: AAA family ATPase [Pseudomonadota bacterium]
MIKSFNIKNFRCFKELNLKDLSTINIIVGDNGSGKTALLEALLISAHGQPGGATLARLTRNRSLPQEQITWNRDLFQALWEDLFFEFGHSKKIVATFVDSFAGGFRLEISYEEAGSKPAFVSSGAIPSLVFVRRGGFPKKTIRTVLRIDEKGQPVFEGRADMAPTIYILPSTTQFFAEAIVNSFSELSRKNAERDVIAALQKEFPEILDISVLTDVNVSTLFVTTKSVPSRKVPLAIVSAGAARYLNILLVIRVTSMGVVLVDEIENGIYWKKMSSIWQTLRQLCIEHNVQLFATTHSNECLQSLVGAMEGHEGDFSLIRTEVVKGVYGAKQFEGKKFLAALKIHGELR